MSLMTAATGFTLNALLLACDLAKYRQGVPEKVATETHDEGITVEALMAERTIAVTPFTQGRWRTTGESQIGSAMRIECKTPSHPSVTRSNPGDSMPDSST
jgi:hypothetical protein